MDCNRFFFQQEERYSIEDIVDNLGVEPEKCEEDFDICNDYQQYSYPVSGIDL